MDNNMINIDDLVRQRLLGGEEHERAGAWGRMNELLEKEMPRKRGIILWRRMFGGLAILALLGGLSLGGYELNSFVRNQNGNNNSGIADAAVPAVGSTSAADAAKPAASSENNTKQIAANSVVENNQPTSNKTASSNNTQHEANNNNNNNQNHTSVNTTAATKTAVTNDNNSSTNQNVTSNNTKQNQTTGSSIAVSKTVKTNERKQPSNNKEGKTDNTENLSKELAVATSNKSEQIKAASKSEKTAVHNKTQVSATNSTKDVANTKQNTTVKHHSSVKTNTGIAVASTVAPVSTSVAEPLPTAGDESTARTINNPAEHPVAGVDNKQPKQHNDKKIAGHKSSTHKNSLSVLSSAAPSVGSEKTASSKPSGTETAVADQPSHTVAVKHQPKTVIKTAAVHNNKIIPAAATTVKPATHTTAKLPAAAKTTAAEKTAKTGSNEKELPAVSTRKGTRTIEKMVVFQRSIKNANKEYSLHLDTISQETISQEYELAMGMKKNAQKTGTEVAASPDADGDTSPFKPNASSSSESSSFAAKENKAKQSKGSMALENLNAAFNDIKFHASKSTFALGMTAGINATFFGPNSFKGFQFGLTGKLTFSDALALMGELKYFHRINNGYTLNDDYYTYTPAAGGGYIREKVLNPYSISTLHSIELPISLRYSKGNFDFFFGPNVVYTFSINAGDYPTTQHNNTPVVVAAPGNDTKGQINAGDFNSRFGLGYLFGVSYQISPKVSIDLRDVQTIWDNASTDGAKRISSQLYRSPSFQLSIGYRFGGNKDK